MGLLAVVLHARAPSPSATPAPLARAAWDVLELPPLLLRCSTGVARPHAVRACGLPAALTLVAFGTEFLLCSCTGCAPLLEAALLLPLPTSRGQPAYLARCWRGKPLADRLPVLYRHLRRFSAV